MDARIQDLSKSLKKYSNKWVALKPRSSKVVAVGRSPKVVIEKARRSGVASPVLTRVPKDYGAYIL